MSVLTQLRARSAGTDRDPPAAGRRFGDLPRPARIALLAVVALAVLSSTFCLVGFPLVITSTSVILTLVATLVGSRLIHVARRIDMSVCHPFVFAAMVLGGPGESMLIAAASVVGGGLLKPGRPMAPHQMVFNASVAAVSTLVSWLTYHGLTGGPVGLEEQVVPILFASLAFYLVNTWTVAPVVALGRGLPIAQVWHEHLVWSAPAFLGGGLLGILVAHLIGSTGPLSILLTLPFIGLVYYCYQLFLGRLDEKRQRLEAMGEVNAELESSVRARTRELERLNHELVLSNRELTTANQEISASRNVLARQNDKLRALEHMRDDMVNMLVHDLKSPISALLLGVEMMGANQPAAPEVERSGASIVRDCTMKISSIVNNVLDVARMESARLELKREVFDFGEALRPTLEYLDVSAHGNDMRLEVEMASELEPFAADAELIVRTVENLVSNAIKVSASDAAILVRVDVDDAGGVLVTVGDRGPGVPEHLRDAIFEKFMTGDATRRARGVNHGLGLTFCKLAVEAHGGRIWVESRAGGGSLFRVHLPRDGGELPEGETAGVRARSRRWGMVPVPVME